MAIMYIVITSAVLAIMFVFTPNIGYNGVISNATLFGITYQLKFDSVPTIINGVTASTSIIIGFTGAIIGLFYRQFENNTQVKNILLYSAFYELVPLTFLFLVYNFLLLGYVDWAIRLSLVAFALSLLTFATVMLGSFLRLTKKNENLQPIDSVTDSEPSNNTRQEISQNTSDLTHGEGETEMDGDVSMESKTHLIEQERDKIKNATIEIVKLQTDPKNAIEIKQKIMEIQSSINKMASYCDPIKYRLDGFTDMANALLGMLSINPTEEEREKYEEYLTKSPKELSKLTGVKLDRRIGVHHNTAYPLWWSTVITPLDVYCCFANSLAFDVNDHVWKLRKLIKSEVSFGNVNFNFGLNI
jgi:hypothetical protein